MKYFWFIGFMLISIVGYGQKMKLGFRSGVSTSNFYNHHHPGVIPNYQITPVTYYDQGTDRPDPVKIDPNTPPKMNYDYYETNLIRDMRVGFFSYVHVNWEIKERLSAEVGLGYSQRGINMKYHLQSTSRLENNNIEKLSYEFNRNLRLDYIVIPATIHYQVDRKERFYVLGGLYNAIAVNFLIKESFTMTDRQTLTPSGQFLGSSSSRSWKEKAYAGLFDTGLIGGFGINLPMTKKLALGLEVRSSFGIVNVPRKFDQYGFQDFRNTAKNLNIESGINVHYLLN